MTPQAKKLAVGFLALGALATWAPQVLQLLQARTNVPESSARPADGPDGAEGGGAPGDASSQGEIPGSNQSTSEPGEEELELEAGGDSGSTSTQVLRNFVASRDAARLEQLTRNLLRARDEELLAVGADEDAPLGQGAGESSSLESDALEALALARFLEENPLCGTLTGSRNAVAIFGSLGVREGEQLPATNAVLERVEARAVVLREGEHTRRIVLQAVHRPRGSQSSPTSPESAATPAAGTQGASTPAAEEMPR
jgi:hypothetical protein